jgi:hypothetical protein
MTYSQNLPVSDPKYDTAECKEIRLRALSYDDKVGERVAVGFASGLLLGPFGLPIAAAADAERNQARQAFSREVHERCSSAPMPPNLMTDAERKDAETAPLSDEHLKIQKKIEDQKKITLQNQ